MAYWRETFFEDNAREVARWAVYVARKSDALPTRERLHQQALRDDDVPGRGGALMEVRADRHIVPDGDFYRIRVKRIASLSCNGKGQLSIYRRSRSRDFSSQPQPWGKWDAAFQVTVNHEENEVRFGPTGQLGNLQSEDKGLGVGRYCLAKVIGWAVDRYPDYKVAAGSLSSVDARTETRRNRRNALYEGAGFIVDYSDNEKKNGLFRAPKVSDLSARWRRGRVREVSLYAMVGALEHTTDKNNRYLNRLGGCLGNADRLKLVNRRLVKVAIVAVIGFVGLAIFVINTS